MRDNIEHQRQLAATVEAAAELNARRAAGPERAAEPPRPGEVFLSRRTADFPVEWLIIEADGDGGARVVPVDEHPYAGSRDLELSPVSLGGAGVVRCDLDAELDASVLEPELRTATLTETELDRVRRKCRAIAGETLEPSLLEEVVDGDPEYHRWRAGTLRPALDALTGRIRDTAPRRRRWLPAVALAAAAVLLALALPLGWQSYQRLDQRIAELEKERQGLETRLATAEAERQRSSAEAGRLEAALAGAVDAAAAARRALAEQQRHFDARLRRAFDVSVAVNVPAFVLRPSGTRSVAREPVPIDPGDAARFTLSLMVPDPDPYPRYRLRVVEQAGAEVWRTDDLVKLGGKWLRLDLPAELFEAGEYQLLIYGLGPDGPRLLDERYTVKLER